MDKVDRYIDEHFDDMLTDLKKLISFNSVREKAKPGAPFGETNKQCLAHMLKICKENGLKVKNFDNYVGTAQWGDNPKLAILSHLDIVPAGKNWDSAPFDAVVKDGKIIGRGAIDDKGPAISSVYALLSVIASGKQPDGGVKLIFGTDEESGSQDLEYYTELEDMPPMVFTPDCDYPIVNIEKGIIRIRLKAKTEKNPKQDIVSIEGSEVVNAVPKTSSAELKGVELNELESLIKSDKSGCKFSLQTNGDLIRIESEGIGVHAMDPKSGKNSLTALIGLICKTSINSKTMDHLKQLNSLFPYEDTCGKTANIYSSNEDSGEVTLSFTMLDMKDDDLIGEIDIRYPTSTTKEIILEKLTDQLSQRGFDVDPYLTMDLHCVDKNSDFVKTLLSVYEDMTGLEGKCLYSGGGTYVHDIENGIAFGPQFANKSYNMHMENEFIPLDELKLNTKMQAEAIIRLATK